MIFRSLIAFCALNIATVLMIPASKEVSAQSQVVSVDSTSMAFQQEVVASMSGHGIHASSGLGIRSSPQERAEAATYLELLFQRFGMAPQRHEYRLPNVNGFVDLLLPPFKGVNIYALVRATREVAPFIVIGAHYDSEPGSPGAGDNASGVAVVFSLARKLNQMESRDFNYIFVFFDQEEDDEVGSKAFVRYLEKRYSDVHSVHITDLAGWDEDGNDVVEVQSPGTMLEARYRLAAGQLGIPIEITKGASSDNKSFLEAGMPTAGVFGDVTRDLHKPTDTFEKVDFQFMHELTDLMFEVLTSMPVEGE
jgi:hypothetical protein